MKLTSSLAVLLALVSAPSFAFPWMVKHGYQSCAACHVDPSGGGQLSMYGRAQADTLLRWKLNRPKAGEEQEVSKTANFLWAFELPEAINVSGNLRGGALIPIGGTVRPLVMATDLYATVKYERFIGHVTTGLGVRNAGPAAILPLCTTSPCGAQWTAREYWAGFTFNDESVVVRAGRMNVPFGLRNNEHFMWVRDVTNTDINVDQQLGVSASYNGDGLRGEVMGLLGNYSLGPDAYRERGYSGFLEWGLRNDVALGISSLITFAGADLVNQQPLTRHAHGLIGRFSPAESLALLGEVDFLAWQQPNVLDRLGFVALVQADFEPIPGLHLIGSVEGQHLGDGARGPSVGGWAAVAWYVLPHVEVRLDTIVRHLARPVGQTATTSTTLLAQIHLFL